MRTRRVSPPARWKAALVGLSVAAYPCLVHAQSSGATDMGSVAVIEPQTNGRPLEGGGSAQPFRLKLPAGATCPGDSANDQWRVDSFFAPTGVDPGSLQHTAAGPSGEYVIPLFTDAGRPLSAVVLETNPQPGEPAVINTVPTLSFRFLPEGAIPPGRYRIGVACTLWQDTLQYWDTEIELTTDSADKPGGFRWAVLSGSAAETTATTTSSSGGGAAPWVLVAGAAGAVGLTAAFVVNRRKGRVLEEVSV